MGEGSAASIEIELLSGDNIGTDLMRRSWGRWWGSKDRLSSQPPPHACDIKHEDQSWVCPQTWGKCAQEFEKMVLGCPRRWFLPAPVPLASRI